MSVKWQQPATAICLLVDRSGSMNGATKAPEAPSTWTGTSMPVSAWKASSASQISCTGSYDPSNVDPRFQRVRIRNEVLPLLASLAPRIVWSLCDLADALASSRPGAAK